MLVWPDGSIVGTVGGGEMEARAIQEALEAMRSGLRFETLRHFAPHLEIETMLGDEVVYE